MKSIFFGKHTGPEPPEAEVYKPVNGLETAGLGLCPSSATRSLRGLGNRAPPLSASDSSLFSTRMNTGLLQKLGDASEMPEQSQSLVNVTWASVIFALNSVPGL